MIDNEDALDETESDWFLALAVVLVPLAAIVAIDPQGWFPFASAKWTAVSIAALVSIAVALVIERGPARPVLDRKMTAFVGALVLLIVASAWTGVAGRAAWFGDPTRHLGALTWMGMLAMFVVGQRAGASERTAATVARWVPWVGLTLGTYVVVEAVFGRPVDWATTSSRLGGPFGSAAYLGAATCLLWPVAFGVMLDRQHRAATRWLAGVAAALLVVAVAGSGSRAAVVGLGTAGLLWGWARWRSERQQDQVGRPMLRGQDDDAQATRSGRTDEALPTSSRPLIGATGAGVLLAMVIAVRSGVFERSAGLASRLDEWRLAIRVIGDHPILGVGPEGYRFVVDRAIDVDYVRTYGEDVAIDRAHSGVLDMALSSGIVAALLYLAALGLVVWCGVVVIRHGSASESGLAVAAIAYAAQQQLLFPIAELDPTFWLFAGIVVARSRSLRRTATAIPTALAEAEAANASAITSASGFNRIASIGTAVGCAVLAAAVVVVGVRAVAADRTARDAVSASTPEQSLALAQRSVDLSPGDVRYRLLLAQAEEAQRSLTGVDAAIVTVEDARQLSPNDPSVEYEFARLVSLRAEITGTPADRARAATVWAEILATRPACARCRFAAAMAAYERGDIDATTQLLIEAADLGDDRALSALQELEELHE